MSNDAPFQGLGRIALAGDPRDLGLALGRAGRAAVTQHLLGHPLWRTVTSDRHAPRVARMAEATQGRFPAIWAEIEGLAEGLALPVHQVFAWNCRGDLLASVPDGCTTVMLPGPEPVLAHNEDGLPVFRNACFIAEVRPQGQPGFIAFCYPGSIPGHTFAFTAAGLVQTVNNLRLTGVEAHLPRMVLGRAVLAAPTLDQAAGLLRDAPSGGFHFALMHRDDRRILSIEFGGGHWSCRPVDAPSVHANHALHLPRAVSTQIVTQSSRDRQSRGEVLLGLHCDALAILRDRGGAGLPIRRDAGDDPDEENTLGTALFRLTDRGLRWSVHDTPDGPARYSGTA